MRTSVIPILVIGAVAAMPLRGYAQPGGTCLSAGASVYVDGDIRLIAEGLQQSSDPSHVCLRVGNCTLSFPTPALANLPQRDAMLQRASGNLERGENDGVVIPAPGAIRGEMPVLVVAQIVLGLCRSTVSASGIQPLPSAPDVWAWTYRSDQRCISLLRRRGSAADRASAVVLHTPSQECPNPAAMNGLASTIARELWSNSPDWLIALGRSAGTGLAVPVSSERPSDLSARVAIRQLGATLNDQYLGRWAENVERAARGRLQLVLTDDPLPSADAVASLGRFARWMAAAAFRMASPTSSNSAAGSDASDSALAWMLRQMASGEADFAGTVFRREVAVMGARP
jgi:hypothetical protein